MVSKIYVRSYQATNSPTRQRRKECATSTRHAVVLFRFKITHGVHGKESSAIRRNCLFPPSILIPFRIPCKSCRCGNWSNTGIFKLTLWTPRVCGGGSRCQAGSLCPKGSPTMIPCTAGRYCAAEGLSQVSGKCIEGYICSEGVNSNGSGAYLPLSGMVLRLQPATIFFAPFEETDLHLHLLALLRQAPKFPPLLAASALRDITVRRVQQSRCRAKQESSTQLRELSRHPAFLPST